MMVKLVHERGIWVKQGTKDVVFGMIIKLLKKRLKKKQGDDK